jgi:hypothetical protein
MGNVIDRKIEEGVDKKLQAILNPKEYKRMKDGKKFNLPFGVRSKARKAHKKNQILCFMLRNDCVIEPVFGLLENGLINIGDKYYDGSQAFIYHWKAKIPCVVIPEWQLTPFGTRHYFKAKRDGNISDDQGIMIRAFEAKEAEGKKKVDMKIWIWAGIGIIIVAYALFARG